MDTTSENNSLTTRIKTTSLIALNENNTYDNKQKQTSLTTKTYKKNNTNDIYNKFLTIMSSPVAWKTVFLIYLYNIFGTQAFYDMSVHVYVGE